jgi:hypothetical protein
MIIARIEYQPDTLRQLCEQVGTRGRKELAVTSVCRQPLYRREH